MESYTPLLDKTRVPQPSLQKYAVISIFEKLRGAPPHLGLDSGPGREAITYCLSTNSPAVVEQAVRELCRLVKDSKMDISRGLLEIQSVLEGADSRFVNVFVKAIGFLVRLGFKKSPRSFRFPSSDVHPFVKVISSRTEVHHELVQQVLMFILENKQLGMLEVCQFLWPFLNYSIVRIPVSPIFPSFVRNLVSSIASLCCSFPTEAIPLLKLLMGCVKFFSRKSTEDVAVLLYFLECISDTYVVVLRQLVGRSVTLQEAELYGVELVETIFELDKDFRLHFGGCENLFNMARGLLVVQKDLGLSYAVRDSPIILSLFTPLIQSKLEQEQLVIVKMLLFLLEWKRESGGYVGRAVNEELLYIFPVINIVSSPCKHVKQAALRVLSFLEKSVNDFLLPPKKQYLNEQKLTAIGKSEWMIYRFLLYILFQDRSSVSCSLYLNYGREIYMEDGHSKPRSCISMLKNYCLQRVEERKSSQSRSFHDTSVEDLSLILGAIASVFLLHPELVHSSTDLFAVIVSMGPELGVSLLLLVLFYNHAFSAKVTDTGFHGILLKLLSLIPSLASNAAMVPLITQTLLPMLQRDSKPVVYATATRLICKTWEINDRVFQSLQELLSPKKFDDFSSKKVICISMAASIRDVCRRNPDRGVDLVLSVASCIENQDPQVQSFGLLSLAHLCEADVIDFYTAWDVIAKHVISYKTNAAVANSLCLLLRWGAMDAEAYAEASVAILSLLWEVGSSRHAGCGSLWTKTRATALRTLCYFEVDHILRTIPDFGKRSMELFLSETDPEVLSVLEEFGARILNYEHVNRRRFVKQKRVPRNRIEKLLDIFPQVIVPLGNENKVRDLPGLALFSFAPKFTAGGMSKDLEEINTRFEDAILEIASSLPLSRNVLMALISLQSWKPFIRRWMKVKLALIDSRANSAILDKTSEAASDILKTVKKFAEDRLPRSAENFALAIGALCLVVPPAGGVKFAASKFLIEWLFQYEHEYRQWSSAISLGLISSCLHPTDNKQKYEIINGLLEVACNSKSTLVKGACGIGLGLSCQDLLMKVDSENVSTSQKETGIFLEAKLVRKIVGVLSQMICQYNPSSIDLLQKLHSFVLGRDDFDIFISNELVDENCGKLQEDTWGIAGLVMGLGICVGAIYRARGQDAVLNLKEWLSSLITCVDPSIQNLTGSTKRKMVLSVGSCLALPTVVTFCQRMELIDDIEVNKLVNGLKDLVSPLVSVGNSGTMHQNLLMAACTGAGNLLSCVLGSGLYSLKVDIVKDMLALFRKAYSSPHPPFVHFGGMLGVINALGAKAGMLKYGTTTMPDVVLDLKKESLDVIGPLLLNSVLEPELTSLIQEMFLMAKNTDDQQMQQYASWAISFIGHYHQEISSQKDTLPAVSASQSFPEDSVVLKLSSWLMTPELGAAHVNTVTSVIRCLSNATRLPALDWQSIIRRCMRFDDPLAKSSPPSPDEGRGSLREGCVLFSLQHANQFDPLLTFLDELSDLTRFKTLEPNLQLCMLVHLSGLIKIFSNSRICTLFDEIASFLSWSALSDRYTLAEKVSLRVSCWKGLYVCLDALSPNAPDYLFNMENCMGVLFLFLPLLGAADAALNPGNSTEWSEAIKCLGKGRQSWLLGLLELPGDFTDENDHLKLVRRIQAKARLVQTGSIPLNELGKVKAYMLNTGSPVIWNALVEVAASLRHAEFNVKRQWLLDALQISCVTSYPSVGLRFVGLLCGNWYRYMPILTLDRNTVLSDLPLTLSSFLQDAQSRINVVEDPIILTLWRLMERIHSWSRSIRMASNDEHVEEDAAESSSSSCINRSENKEANLLLMVVYEACLSLKNFMSLEMQLSLANMLLPPLPDN